MAATHPNLSFSEIPGYRPLHMDLHLPADDGPWPVLFWIHGGGWQSGSRLWLPDSIAPFGFHDRLTRRGYAVADVDYRLSAEAPFPAQFDDVQAAIRWTRAHASDFGLDPGRFAALGESAGAHLAVLAGMRGGDEMATETRLHAVVNWYGPMDLLDFRAPEPGSSQALLLGGQPHDLPDIARAASPITYTHADAPPLLTVHGTADDIVPFEQAEKITKALHGHGVRADLIAVPGADHCFIGCSDIGALIDKSIDFLDDVLGSPQPGY